MPKIGEVFIDSVFEEKIDKNMNVTTHPIEDGENVGDHVERKSRTLDISGVFVGRDTSARRAKIEQYMNSGEVLVFTNKNKMSNLVIEKFEQIHDVDVKRGFKFKMALFQILFATKSTLAKPKQTKKKTSGGQKQPNNKKKPAKIYVVKKGDTLSHIALKYLGSANKWPDIYNKNKKVIGSNPHLIKPNQRLVIP